MLAARLLGVRSLAAAAGGARRLAGAADLPALAMLAVPQATWGRMPAVRLAHGRPAPAGSPWRRNRPSACRPRRPRAPQDGALERLLPLMKAPGAAVSLVPQVAPLVRRCAKLQEGCRVYAILSNPVPAAQAGGCITITFLLRVVGDPVALAEDLERLQHAGFMQLTV